MGEGAKQARAGTIEGNPENKTSTTNKMPQTCEVEHQEEGGEAMPDRANKTTPPSADIVASLATTRQSITRRRENRPSQADNSQTTPPTPTTTIVAGCL